MNGQTPDRVMDCVSMAMHSHKRSRQDTMMRDRVGRRRSARPHPRRVWTHTAPVILALSVLFTAGCKNESPQAGEQPSGTSTPPATFAPKPEDEAIEAWKTALGVTTKDPAAVAAARAVADPGALNDVEKYFDTPTTLTSNARAVVGAAGTVEVQDCVFMDPRGNREGAAVGFRATARKDPDKWKIARSQLFGRDTGDGYRIACIPRQMSEAVLRGYNAYWEAAPKLWSDGNPDNPLLAQVAIGTTRDNTRAKLEDYRRRNAVVRNNPVTHPEIVQVVSPTEVVIRDCQDPDPNYGLFDRSTGARLPDAEPTPLGERDLAEVHMQLEGGAWKFAKFSYGSGSQCQIAPTDRGVAVL
jgi:hypothetical protein